MDYFSYKISIWFCFFAETSSFQECSPFLEHFYNNALKSCQIIPTVGIISVSVCLLSHASWDVPTQFWIAFFSIIRLWVLFKFYGGCSFLWFSMQSPLSGLACKLQPAFCGLWFQCQFGFQSLQCFAAWICPVCTTHWPVGDRWLSISVQFSKVLVCCLGWNSCHVLLRSEPRGS